MEFVGGPDGSYDQKYSRLLDTAAYLPTLLDLKETTTLHTGMCHDNARPPPHIQECRVEHVSGKDRDNLQQQK